MIWFDPSNANAVVTSSGSVTQLTNLGSLGSIANATVASGSLAPKLNTANSAFNHLPSVSFGYYGEDTPRGLDQQRPWERHANAVQ